MPSIPKTIAIKVTSGVKGQPITIRNRNTGYVVHTTLQNAGKGIIGAAVDLQNFDNNYTSGDVIDFIVSGEQLGANSLTTSGDKGESVTISTATISSSMVRGIR